MEFYLKKCAWIRIVYITLFTICVPFISISQVHGVNFVNNLTWQKVLEKARAENKYILIDCYATWCIPCKKMEKEVFTNDSVSNVINKNFIAVRVQIDTSEKDNAYIKEWYGDANNIRNIYNINAYPSFLFLKPGGELVHKGVGYYPDATFISLAKDALNPDKQFYTLYKKYQKGIKNDEQMRLLAMNASRFLDESLSKRIVYDYINNYLLKLKKGDVFTKENLAFITQYCIKSRDKGFQLIYHDPEKVNKVFERPGFAQDWINAVIGMEETQLIMNEAFKVKGESPDWERMRNTIKGKYNSYYANRAVTDAKIRWYSATKEWEKLTKYTVEYVENFGKHFGDFDLANKSWNVFLYSNNKQELLSALGWTQKVLARSTDSTNIIPNVMDTQANILHKVNYIFEGKKTSEEAIKIEEQVLAIWMDNKVDQQTIQSFNNTLDKMKQGQLTWPAK